MLPTEFKLPTAGQVGTVEEVKPGPSIGNRREAEGRLRLLTGG
jgi:hypothetical protein